MPRVDRAVDPGHNKRVFRSRRKFHGGSRTAEPSVQTYGHRTIDHHDFLVHRANAADLILVRKHHQSMEFGQGHGFRWFVFVSLLETLIDVEANDAVPFEEGFLYIDRVDLGVEETCGSDPRELPLQELRGGRLRFDEQLDFALRMATGKLPVLQVCQGGIAKESEERAEVVRFPRRINLMFEVVERSREGERACRRSSHRH